MRRTLGVMAVAGLVLVGCGGSGGSDKSSPSDYADAICVALGEFLARSEPLGVAVTELQAASPTSVEELEEFLGEAVVFFDDFAAEIGELADQVDDAGNPDTDGGEEFAQGIVGALRDSQQVLADAGAALEDVDPDSVSELTELGEQFDSLDQAFEAIDFNFEEDAPESVQQAVDESETCREVQEEFGVFGP